MTPTASAHSAPSPISRAASIAGKAPPSTRRLVGEGAQPRRRDHGAAQKGLEQQTASAGSHYAQGFQRPESQAALRHRNIEREHAELSKPGPSGLVPP